MTTFIMSSDCGLYPVCNGLGLAGECCPTIDAWTLDCCNDILPVQPLCQDNPACAALDLTGSCCPTVDEVFLTCCEQVPDECFEEGACVGAPPEATCELNPTCNDLGLEGLCCPTVDDWTLDCCTGIVPVEPLCQDNPACAALNLDGFCCPTVDDVFLTCCEEVPNECQEPGSCESAPPEATCQLNSVCNNLELEGLCCPSELFSFSFLLLETSSDYSSLLSHWLFHFVSLLYSCGWMDLGLLHRNCSCGATVPGQPSLCSTQLGWFVLSYS